MSEKLSELLNVEHHDIVMDVPQTDVPEAVENVEDADFAAARANTYELIDMSKASLNTALHVAAESQNPRALEVVGQLLKTAAEINKQLVVLSKDRAEVKLAKGGNKPGALPQQNIQNAVFVGSSADLNKMIADRMKAQT